MKYLYGFAALFQSVWPITEAFVFGYWAVLFLPVHMISIAAILRAFKEECDREEKERAGRGNARPGRK